MNPRDFLSGAVAGAIGTVALVAIALSVRMLSDNATPPPPSEPPMQLIGVADDVDIYVFNDHENRNVCYITTNNRQRAAAGSISCVPKVIK